MKTDRIKFRYLFSKYTSKEISEEEKNEFLAMAADDHYAHILRELIWSEVENTGEDHDMEEARAEEIFEKIIHENPSLIRITKSNRFGRYPRVALFAAVVLGLIVWGVRAIMISKTGTPTVVKQNMDTPNGNDIAPGRSGAILTLSDGTTMVLDSLGNGLVASQGSARILKRGTRIDYTKGDASHGEMIYNTMTTPNGRQFQLVLADGSAVWLNAASSITYPTSFSDKERRVTITGEAYFEIKPLRASGKAVPFVVSITSADGTQKEIQVLGTHFNVNAYANESAVRTTLIEGSVRVRNGGNSLMIKPGQQAVMKKQTQEMNLVKDVDLDETIAWKNGFFSFKRASIEEIMRKVERWYDVRVEYVDGVPPGHYAGDVPMNVNASEMLKVLQLGGIRFSIEGKRIIVR